MLLTSSHNFESHEEIIEQEVKQFLLPPITPGKNLTRGTVESQFFAPNISIMTASETEQRKRELERESRRKRRHTSRSKRVMDAQDYERPKTYRTPIPSPGEEAKFSPVII